MSVQEDLDEHTIRSHVPAAMKLCFGLTPFAIARWCLPNGDSGGYGPFLLWLALLYSSWFLHSFYLINWILGSEAPRRFDAAQHLPRNPSFHPFALAAGFFVTYCILLLLAGLRLFNAVGIGISLMIACLAAAKLKMSTGSIYGKCSGVSVSVPRGKAAFILTVIAGIVCVIATVSATSGRRLFYRCCFCREHPPGRGPMFKNILHSMAACEEH